MDEAVREGWQQGPSLIASLWRYRRLLVVAALAGGLGGCVVSLVQPTRYAATAMLVLADQESRSVFGHANAPIDPERYVAKQAERAMSSPVLTQASLLLGDSPSAAELRRVVEVNAFPAVEQIEIVAKDSTADGAAAIARAVAVAYQQRLSREVSETVDEAIDQIAAAREDLEERIAQLEDELAADPNDFGLNGRLDAAVQQLAALQTRASELAVDGALRASGVGRLEPVQVPDAPEQPQPGRNAAVAAVLGLVGAGAFAYSRAGNAQVADTSDAPGAVLDAPLLGEVPTFREKKISHTSLESVSGVAEAYQFVVASLEYALPTTGGSHVLFTSPNAGDGKSVTALNTALAAQRDGRRVLLVDGDLRDYGLSRMTATTGAPGLSNLAEEGMEPAECIQTLPITDSVWLPVVAAGSPVEDPPSFLRTPAFRKAMLRMKDNADLIIIDSPPLLAVSDTSAVAGQVDGIVLVVNRGTRTSQLEAVRDRLAFIGTPLLGYVFNRAGRRGADRTYGRLNPLTTSQGRIDNWLSRAAGQRRTAGRA